MPPNKPPPRPFFLGRTVSAREEALGSLPRLVALRPRHGHAFTSPPGTTTLYLPPDTLVSVSARRLEDPGWSALRFVGDFHDVNRPPEEWLSPIASGDADALVETFCKRYSLPRCPVEVPTRTLGRGKERRFVSVVDEYKPRHPELANFAGLSLTASQAFLGSAEANRFLRATGFVYPGGASRPDAPRVVGYSGPILRAISLQEPGFTYPFESATGTTFSAYVGAVSPNYWAPEVASRIRPLDARRTFATLLAGIGQQGRDTWAVDLANLVVHLLFDPSDRVMNAAPETLFSMASNLGEVIDQNLDRSPLPREPRALIEAVASRLASVYEAFQAQDATLDAQGVFVCVEGPRITLLRRGLARVYRLRDGQLSRMVHEQPSSVTLRFGPAEPDASLAVLDGQPGDRYVVLAGSVVALPSDDLVASSLREATLEAMVARMREHRSWGALLIDLSTG